MKHWRQAQKSNLFLTTPIQPHPTASAEGAASQEPIALSLPHVLRRRVLPTVTVVASPASHHLYQSSKSQHRSLIGPAALAHMPQHFAYQAAACVPVDRHTSPESAQLALAAHGDRPSLRSECARRPPAVCVQSR